MSRIDEIKAEIIKLEKTSDVGLELYKIYEESELLQNAVYFSNEALKLRKLLEEEYNVVV